MKQLEDLVPTKKGSFHDPHEQIMKELHLDQNVAMDLLKFVLKDLRTELTSAKYTSEIVESYKKHYEENLKDVEIEYLKDSIEHLEKMKSEDKHYNDIILKFDELVHESGITRLRTPGFFGRSAPSRITANIEDQFNKIKNFISEVQNHSFGVEHEEFDLVEHHYKLGAILGVLQRTAYDIRVCGGQYKMYENVANDAIKYILETNNFEDRQYHHDLENYISLKSSVPSLPDPPEAMDTSSITKGFEAR